MVESAAHLVDHILPEQPIRQWVLTFPYPLRFLFAARPQVLSQVLGVVYRAISTYLIKKTGFTVASGAKTGAVTLIQRFGSALNLSDYLDFEPGEAFDRLVGASIHYRIAIGPNAGRTALTLRTVPVKSEPFPSTLLARLPGFSLHAATVCEAAQRDKLEKLCRYIARPAIANEQLSTNERGQVIYRFRQPFRDGCTHVVLDPLELMAHIHVRHPSGDLRSSKSAVWPICHRPPGGFGSASAIEPDPVPRRVRAELQAS